MNYQTPAALENAVKDAAKNSDMDTGRAIVLFWWDRFLARVFSSDHPEFVLKGGLSMLARMSTRYTKDVDLAAAEMNIESAQKRLVELATVNLNDFFRFDFLGEEPITVEDDYRDGKRISFSVTIGAQRKGEIKVDLVVGCTPIGEAEKIIPSHQLKIKGLEPTEYYLYPTVDTMADKISATLSMYPDGKSSSRVKDLSDLILIATTTQIDAATLGAAIKGETSQRAIKAVTEFAVPDSWKVLPLSTKYQKLAEEAGLAKSLYDVLAAERLIANMIDPILSGKISEGVWNPDTLEWMEAN